MSLFKKIYPNTAIWTFSEHHFILPKSFNIHPQPKELIMSNTPSPLYQRIYAQIRQVPPGRVTSYGRIGKIVGCTARSVGFALAALPVGSDVPWQRIINAQGKISPRTDSEGNVLQRDLLEAEGVGFDRRQRINISKYGWDFQDEGM